MLSNMMFDNAPIQAPSRLAVIRDHLPIIALVAACLGVAGGIHFASTAIAVIAAGHLAIAGALFAMQAMRRRNTGVQL